MACDNQGVESGEPYRPQLGSGVECSAFVRAVTEILRGGPEMAGGRIGASGISEPSGDTTHYVLSPGYALIHGRAHGHDGPIIVWADGTWEVADPNDLPPGFSRTGWERVNAQ